METRIHAMRLEAEGVISIELRPVNGGELPPFEAGAHVNVDLPHGMVRSYSLLNSALERHRYVVAVLKSPASRGGSSFIHEHYRLGMSVWISPPRQHFPLQEDASYSVLIAGGIGVTPILCMARRLQDLGRPFELMYFARTRRSAAFLEELEAFGVPLHIHFDEQSGCVPDLDALLRARTCPPGTHWYACGPSPMLDRFVEVCAGLGHTNAHIERFGAATQPPVAHEQEAYSVELRRSGKTVVVEPATTLLKTLIRQGIPVSYSCEEGVCGACETRVLDGVPDHQDSVLSDSEKASNTVMMICVSGCKSGRLALDL